MEVVMTGTFAAPADGYVNVPLLDGEQMIRQQSCGYLHAGLNWGGKLAITNQRVLFRPMDFGVINTIVADGLDLLPDSIAQVGKLVSRVVNYAATYGDRLAGAVPYATIRAANAGDGSKLILTTDTGRQTNLGIAASLWTPKVHDCQEHRRTRRSLRHPSGTTPSGSVVTASLPRDFPRISPCPGS
jgi:hypothetical protein